VRFGLGAFVVLIWLPIFPEKLQLLGIMGN